MWEGIKFALVGGDLRQRELGRFLKQDGGQVAAFALGGSGEGSLAGTLRGAQVVILPLPAMDAQGCVNTPLSEEKLELEQVLDLMEPEQLLCAGRATACLREMAQNRSIELVDYFDREELAVLNAVATAEGAIQIMMEELPITLWRAKVLVLGNGRIGRVLADRLRGLGAEISVSARRYADMAWIRAMGGQALDTRSLGEELGSFDCVVNTVPALILDRERLEKLRGDCLCLDLASKPGGLDFQAASKLGLRAIWALSLPGKVAPVSSGAILRDTIGNILEERGKSQ